MVSPASRIVSAKLRPALPRAKSKIRGFDVKRFLDSTGLGRKVGKFAKKETVFAQGDPAKHVMYIQEGGMKLSVVNQTGREAVVAILGPGDFFGEGCLGGQSRCMATATAIAPTTVLVIDKTEMIRVLHEEHQFSDRFIAYMLARNIRVEEDLIDSSSIPAKNASRAPSFSSRATVPPAIRRNRCPKFRKRPWPK